MPTSSMPLPSRPHVPLVKCRVQFLGRAAPAEVQDGTFALQKPLQELFCEFRPEVAVLTVYTSGLSLHQVSAPGFNGDLWFPIQDLKECAALRPVGTVGNIPEIFVPLSDTNSSGLAIFAFVFCRPDIPVSDCWAVITKSDEAAMALLSSTEMAHGNRAGWTTKGDRPPSLTQPSGISIKTNDDWDGAVAKEGIAMGKDLPMDYYEKPPLKGFFYAPTAAVIKQYDVGAMCCEYVPDQPCQPAQMMATPDNDGFQTVDFYFPYDEGYPVQIPDAQTTGGYFVDFPGQTPQYAQPMLVQPQFVGPPPYVQPQFVQPQIVQRQPPEFVPFRIPAQQGATFVVPEAVEQVRCARPVPGFTGGASCAPKQQGGYFPGYQQPQQHQAGFFPGKFSEKIPDEESSDSDDSEKGSRKQKKKKKKSKKLTSDTKQRDYAVRETGAVVRQPREQQFTDEHMFEQYLPNRVPASYNANPAGAAGSADYLRPVSDRRYESHISPGGFANGVGSYLDEGPYESRLPIPEAAAMRPQNKSQNPKAHNGNFILRQTNDYRY